MPLSKIVAKSITDDTITTDQIADTSVHGRRNLIINGAMEVAQRGTSSTAANNQTVDRFQNSRNTDGGVTQSQTDLTSGSPYDEGFRHVYRQTMSTASSTPAAAHYLASLQLIEASTVATSGWNYTSDSSYLTLSFWAKSSVAGTYVFQFRTNDGTAQAYSFEYTLVADTWKKVTHSIPGNSNITINNDNGRGLELYWWIYIGTNYDDSSHTNEVWEAYSGSSQSKPFAQNWMTTANATFDVTGVQLEVGDKATPFEHRSYGEELALCQRYFVRFDASTQGDYARIGVAVQTTSTAARGSIFLPVPMRTEPSSAYSGTARIEGTSAKNLTAIGQSGNSSIFNLGCDPTFSSSGSAGDAGFLDTGANGKIDADAEL